MHVRSSRDRIEKKRTYNQYRIAVDTHEAGAVEESACKQLCVCCGCDVTVTSRNSDSVNVGRSTQKCLLACVSGRVTMR